MMTILSQQPMAPVYDFTTREKEFLRSILYAEHCKIIQGVAGIHILLLMTPGSFIFGFLPYKSKFLISCVMKLSQQHMAPIRFDKSREGIFASNTLCGTLWDNTVGRRSSYSAFDYTSFIHFCHTKVSFWFLVYVRKQIKSYSSLGLIWTTL